MQTNDEIGVLSHSFDAMAAAVETKIGEMDETLQSQKDFIAAFTHEVKTPMTAMLGYADLMRAAPDDADLQRESANYIYHETRRLEELSRRLLALQVDRALWVDMLRNLTINAQRACKGIAGAAITLRCRQQGSIAVFTVADTGCGIPAADLPRVTEAFYMVAKSRSRADGGSGIGLALCTRIAQAHGTQLQIDSTEGVGTTVTVSVPILGPDDLPAADADGKEQP